MYHKINTLLMTLFLGFVLSGSGLFYLNFGETCCLHLQIWKLKLDNVVSQPGQTTHLNCIYYAADIQWSQKRECPSKLLLGRTIHMLETVQSINLTLFFLQLCTSWMCGVVYILPRTIVCILPRTIVCIYSFYKRSSWGWTDEVQNKYSWNLSAN